MRVTLSPRGHPRETHSRLRHCPRAKCRSQSRRRNLLPPPEVAPLEPLPIDLGQHRVHVDVTIVVGLQQHFEVGVSHGPGTGRNSNQSPPSRFQATRSRVFIFKMPPRAKGKSSRKQSNQGPPHPPPTYRDTSVTLLLMTHGHTPPPPTPTQPPQLQFQPWHTSEAPISSEGPGGPIWARKTMRGF